MAPSKSSLKLELEQSLGADLEARERAQRAAMEGATHEEAKPENDKDTRALEQSYLALGEALRVEELRAGLLSVRSMPVRAFGADEPASTGALVRVEQDGAPMLLLLAPYGGGTRLSSGAVQVVTPQSPLGRGVLGKRAGDEVEVQLGGRTRTLVVTTVE